MKTRLMSTTVAMIAGLLAMMAVPSVARAGHFILGAPGVTITDVTVNTGASCFKQGDTLIVSGHGFGAEAGDHIIAYAAQGPMPIESWEDEQIKFRIPTAAEAPKLTPIGDTLMIMQGKKPFALYGQGPAFCSGAK